MTSKFRMKCPSCGVKFPWNVEKNGFPEYCPNPECATRVAHDRDDDDIVMPSIRTMASKSNDALYRQMEAASEVRAEQAAAQAGVSVSDMSDVKITNLNSASRQGEIAAPMVNNTVTQFMAANPNTTGFNGGGGLGYSSNVQAGPHPNMGARLRTAVQSEHARVVAREGLPGRSVTSDMPALETAQPGYRRRG